MNTVWEGTRAPAWTWLSYSGGGGRQVVNIQPTSASDSSALQTQHRRSSQKQLAAPGLIILNRGWVFRSDLAFMTYSNGDFFPPQMSSVAFP